MKKETIMRIVATLLLLIFIVCPVVGLMYCTFNQPQTLEVINDNIVVEEQQEIQDVDAIIEEIEEDINSLPATTIYTTTSVHLRTEPSLDAEIADTLTINTQLDSLGSIDDWTIVRVNGQRYYVYSLYTSNTETEIKVTSRSKSTERTNAATQVKESSTPAAATSNENGEFLGYYTLTYYCSCSKCCGQYANGVTAWGTTAVAGRTVAVPTSISLGTKLNIGGHEYVAEDRGGAIKGNKIDIYVNSHSEALAKGVTKNIPVWKIN